MNKFFINIVISVIFILLFIFVVIVPIEVFSYLWINYSKNPLNKILRVLIQGAEFKNHSP